MHIINKSTKLPKKVAGFRIPKKMRIGGGKLVDLISSPLMATLAVPLVIAGAVAIKNSKAVRAAAVKAKDKIRGTIDHLTAPTDSVPASIGAA